MSRAMVQDLQMTELIIHAILLTCRPLNTLKCLTTQGNGLGYDSSYTCERIDLTPYVEPIHYLHSAHIMPVPDLTQIGEGGFMAPVPDLLSWCTSDVPKL